MRAGLGFIGLTFTVIAAYFMYVGFSLQITVQSADPPGGFQGIANLQLMHIQLLDILIGTGAAIVAAIFLVGAALAQSTAEGFAAEAGE
jgi:hypothetical protein